MKKIIILSVIVAIISRILPDSWKSIPTDSSANTKIYICRIPQASSIRAPTTIQLRRNPIRTQL